jgi:hypothetical protein
MDLRGSLTSYAFKFARHDDKLNFAAGRTFTPAFSDTSLRNLVGQGRSELLWVSTLLILLATILLSVERRFRCLCGWEVLSTLPHQNRDMVRREDSQQVPRQQRAQRTLSQHPAIKEVTDVNAVSLRYVSLLKHFLADGKWHDPTSALDKTR